MEINKEHFKKLYPHLAEEFNVEEQRIDNPVRSELKTLEKKFSKYTPNVIDFIRRCDNSKQAKKIINYLEKRGEINYEYATMLKKQLKKLGLRSFGPKKEEEYYLKHGKL